MVSKFGEDTVRSVSRVWPCGVLLSRAFSRARPVRARLTVYLSAGAAIFSYRNPRSVALVCLTRRLESKNPDDKFIGVFVLATSYSRTAYRRTTIGAAAFHFRVRNGNGWCHHAKVTRAEKR